MECECKCKPMTVVETLLTRGHYSPKNVDLAIKFCPLHEAAGELLEAAKGAMTDMEDLSENQEQDYSVPSRRVMEKLFNAIIKAEGGSKHGT